MNTYSIDDSKPLDFNSPAPAYGLFNEANEMVGVYHFRMCLIRDLTLADWTTLLKAEAAKKGLTVSQITLAQMFDNENKRLWDMGIEPGSYEYRTRVMMSTDSQPGQNYYDLWMQKEQWKP